MFYGYYTHQAAIVKELKGTESGSPVDVLCGATERLGDIHVQVRLNSAPSALVVCV